MAPKESFPVVAVAVALCCCLNGISAAQQPERHHPVHPQNVQPTSTEAAAVFRDAFDLYRSGQLEAARILFKKGLAISPKDYRALYVLAQIEAQVGSLDDAANAYEHVIELAPNSKEAALSEVSLKLLKQKREAEVRERQGAARKDEVNRARQTWEDGGRRIASRFAIVSGGVVADVQTGFEWTQSDNGADIDWQAATNWCVEKDAGWTLPSARELASLYYATELVACGPTSSCGVSATFHLTDPWFWTREHSGNGSLAVSLSTGMALTSISSDESIHKRAICIRK